VAKVESASSAGEEETGIRDDIQVDIKVKNLRERACVTSL